ncbi:MAG: LysR family transcriptional regulator [Verrucomicrobiota bacterium]
MDTSDNPKQPQRRMEWLNYHHLRYFWTVAKEGSLARAAAKLHVAQPSISEQVRELEDALGEKLFRREGRNNKLTDAGQMAFGYADEIFALGRELMNAIKQRPSARVLRFYVGVVDSFPKFVTNDILAPVFAMPQTVHVICREGKLEELLVQLATHRLDIVLSDELASSSTSFKTFHHPLGETSTTFCAEKKLAAKLRPGFPQSLHEAPALLPAENTTLRRLLEKWFRDQAIAPRVVAEFEDLALMKVMAAQGRGFIAVPTVVLKDAMVHYAFQPVGEAPPCRLFFHAITGERRIAHPAVALITRNPLEIRPAKAGSLGELSGLDAPG